MLLVCGLLLLFTTHTKTSNLDMDFGVSVSLKVAVNTTEVYIKSYSLLLTVRVSWFIHLLQFLLIQIIQIFSYEISNLSN